MAKPFLQILSHFLPLFRYDREDYSIAVGARPGNPVMTEQTLLLRTKLQKGSLAARVSRADTELDPQSASIEGLTQHKQLGFCIDGGAAMLRPEPSVTDFQRSVLRIDVQEA